MVLTVIVFADAEAKASVSDTAASERFAVVVCMICSCESDAIVLSVPELEVLRRAVETVLENLVVQRAHRDVVQRECLPLRAEIDRIAEPQCRRTRHGGIARLLQFQ